MKGIILAAGQGSRLMPLTEDTPKCLLRLGDQTILRHQIRQLATAGFKEIVVTTGFRAAAVEAELHQLYQPTLGIRTLYNPFFAVADNLASCWLARSEMTGDFLLVNGDTVFEAEIPERLIEQARRPITLTIDCKDDYDSDDMKVSVEADRLVEVGKRLSSTLIDGESIGMSWYHGRGPRLFTEMLEQMMRGPHGVNSWYLKAIDALAGQGHVGVVSIKGLTWGEVDFPHDLARVRRLFAMEHVAVEMVIAA